MTILKHKIVLGLGVLIFVSCNQIDNSKMSNTITTSPNSQSIKKEVGERLKISGDFNGDKIIDTVYESYISKLTHKETYKILDSEDWEHNTELIIKNAPICRIYTNIALVDTFIITKEGQQTGISLFENLGDINGDGKDELGYIVNWTDNSNLNTYHILTLNKKNFYEIFNFKINEMVNFESDNLLDNKSFIKQISNKKIKYKFYTDSATVETKEHSFN